MATVVSFAAVSLLLLMCGQLLRRVSAANSLKALDTVSRIAGFYSNFAQVEADLATYPELQKDFKTSLYLPVNIPALNDHLPMKFQLNQSGDVLRTGIILHYNDATVAGYFTFDDAYNYVPGQDLTDLTLNDLNEEAFCMARVILQGEEAIHDRVCIGAPNEPYLMFSFIHTCTSLTAMQGDRIKGIYSGETSYFDKVQQFPLPGSWLVGHQDYVSPCAV